MSKCTRGPLCLPPSRQPSLVSAPQVTPLFRRVDWRCSVFFKLVLSRPRRAAGRGRRHAYPALAAGAASVVSLAISPPPPGRSVSRPESQVEPSGCGRETTSHSGHCMSVLAVTIALNHMCITLSLILPSLFGNCHRFPLNSLSPPRVNKGKYNSTE